MGAPVRHLRIIHMIPFKPIEGRLVRLRQITAADEKDMFEWASDPEVSRHLPWNAHESIKETRAYIRECIDAYVNGEWIPLAIEDIDTGRVEGNIALYSVKPRHGIAEIAFVLSPKLWGGGHLMEAASLLIGWAFRELEINRIQAVASVDNVHSFSALERMGMKYEGILRQYMSINGRFCDVKIYAILKSEWPERN